MFSLKSVLFGLAVSASLAALPVVEAGAIGACGPIKANVGGVHDEAALNGSFEDRMVQNLNKLDLIPGLAIGIVKGNEVIYAKGFGFSDLETCEPVTTGTGFYILSTTKSFTGMTAALLQEEGNFEIDQSIGHYFPDLKIDDLNPSQITIRQLLTHSQPFSNGTINYRTFAPGNLPNSELAEVLEKFSSPKDPTFAYSNTAYILAAWAMEAATGKTWRDLNEEYVFQLLGMDNTTSYMARALEGDYAKPYARNANGDIIPGFQKTENQMHAAGGAVSTVDDMNRWLIANLDGGRLEGVQVLPARAVRQAQAPQTQFSWDYGDFHRFAYGFGVHNADYEGDLLIHHFGGAIHMSYMPEHDLGIVILANNTGMGASFTHRIAALAYDQLLGKENLDQRWQEAMADTKASLERSWDRSKQFQERLASMVNPEDPIVEESEITGRYLSERLGEISIEKNESGYQVVYGEIKSPLVRLDGNSFTAHLIPLDLYPADIIDFKEKTDDGRYVLDWGGRLFERQ